VKLKGMSDGDTFLAIYVLLSRATKLDDLLLVGMRARQLFEKGLLALPVLQQRMKALEDRAAPDRDAAKGIMKSLDWPNSQHFDDAFEAAANHEPGNRTGRGLGLTALGAATCSHNELHVAHEGLAM